MKKDEENYYIDNVKFLEHIIEHKRKVLLAKNEGKIEPRLSNYLGECITLIANKLANHPWYSRWTFREEMISDAIENIIMYFDRFDAEKYTNPFAYYTQIAKWAFQRRMALEMKMTYKKYKYFEQTIVNPGLTDLITDGDNNLISVPIYDNITKFIEDYEEREVIRKDKIKKTKSLSTTNTLKPTTKIED